MSIQMEMKRYIWSNWEMWKLQSSQTRLLRTLLEIDPSFIVEIIYTINLGKKYGLVTQRKIMFLIFYWNNNKI